MSSTYCVSCDRIVEAKRKIGVGTLLLAIISMGFSLLLIPFYEKRCPICQGTNFRNPNSSSALKPVEYDKSATTLQSPGTKELKKCPYCAEDILIAAIKCKHCGSNIEVSTGN